MFRNLKLGSQIIYDCGSEKHMPPHEIKNTAIQMTIAFGLNRKHKKPFLLHEYEQKRADVCTIVEKHDDNLKSRLPNHCDGRYVSGAYTDRTNGLFDTGFIQFIDPLQPR